MMCPFVSDMDAGSQKPGFDSHFFYNTIFFTNTIVQNSCVPERDENIINPNERRCLITHWFSTWSGLLTSWDEHHQKFNSQPICMHLIAFKIQCCMSDFIQLSYKFFPSPLPHFCHQHISRFFNLKFKIFHNFPARCPPLVLFNIGK